jgi:heme oxygenase
MTRLVAKTIIMEQLRTATAAEHAAVERLVPLMRADVTVDHYRRYLGRMWGIQAPFDALLDEEAAGAALPDAAARRRAATLRADLVALGLGDEAIDRLPLCALPLTCEPASLLGGLYVLEGSTLGGQIIRRHLQRHLGAETAVATRYLGAYDDVPRMWSRFCAAVDAFALAHPSATPQLVGAAVATFAAVRAWLAAGAGG